MQHRRFRDTEKPLVIVFFFPLVAMPISGIYTIFHFVIPIGLDWLILLLIGISTQIAQINMTKALQLETMAKVSIVRYLTIVYAIIYSYTQTT